MPMLTTTMPTVPETTRESVEETLILIVDDSIVQRRLTGRYVEKHDGWKALFASNGVEALAVLEKISPRIILSDLQMPEMDGLALVKKVREKYPIIPVVLMTGRGSEEIAIQALNVGAASYVPKRTLDTNLESTLEQVLGASQRGATLRRVLDCMTQRDARFTLGNDPALISPLVRMLQGDLLDMRICDATGATRVGIALEEAIMNALYRGNLEMSPQLRDDNEGEYYRLAEERRETKPYRDRSIRLFANLTTTEAAYVIFDQGPGFAVADLPDPTNPASLDTASGRGVLLMRTFLDRVSYSCAGNQVTLIKKRETQSTAGNN